MRYRLIVTVALLALPLLARAETMYVTDKLEVTVRAGKGVENKALGFVRANERVEVLESDGTYSLVKLPDGTEGWILTRYLTDTVPRAIDAGVAAAEIVRLQDAHKTTQEELAALRQEKAGIENVQAQKDARVQELEAALAELRRECADYIKLRDDNQRLRQEEQSNRAIIAQLTRENEELNKKTELMWFIFGAGAVLCGFIIGMWLQGLRSRRRPKISF